MADSTDSSLVPEDQGEGVQAIPGPRRWLVLGLVFAALTAFGLRGLPTEASRAPLELMRLLLVWPAPLWLGLLLAVYFAADALRLHFILAALGHRLAWQSQLKLVFVNYFVSNLTPLATGGGFAQVWFLGRRGVPIGAATAATTLRTLMAAAMIFGAVPIALLRIERLQSWPAAGELLFGLAAVSLFVLLALVVVVRRPVWLLVIGAGLLELPRRVGLLSDERHARWSSALRRETLHFARAGQTYASGGRRELALAALATFVFLLALFSFPALLLVSLGYRPPYLDLLGLLTLTTSVLYVAPTPGAAGIAEGVFGRLLADIVAPEVLPFLTLAWRALTIHLGMLIGLVILYRELASAGSGSAEAVGGPRQR